MGEKRYCIGCVHMVFDSGCEGGGYSTLTGPWDRSVELRCGKGHWEVEQGETSQDEFAEHMESATDCPDFEERQTP